MSDIPPDQAAAWEIVDFGTFSEVNRPDESDGYGENLAKTEENTATEDPPPGEDITDESLARFRRDFCKEESGSVAQNAIAQMSLLDATLSQNVRHQSLDSYWGIDLDRGSMPATNQKDSGRCWMFGALNLFRFGTMEKLGVDDFEFSESYLYFWYLLEQCNYCCEYAIRYWEVPLDDRRVSDFLDSPIDDGGDWDIAVNLLKKYGVVPKNVFPETYSSSNTDELIEVLTTLLRATVRTLRLTLQQGSSVEQARDIKWKTVGDAYRILAIHLGSPPTEFCWQYRDNEGNFHQMTNITPQAFADSFITVPFSQYISLIQDPRHEYYKRYAVLDSMPIAENAPTCFINIPAEEMKQMCLNMLQDKLPVWFACNVNEQCDNDDGLWDEHLYRTYELYGIRDVDPDPSRHMIYDKAERIRYGTPMGTHVMLMTGADSSCTDNDDENDARSVRRWRVENSWGSYAGDNGYYTMNDNWFAPNVFEVVAPPQYLSDKAKMAMGLDPILLPPWDPMCSRGKRGRRRRTRARGGGGGGGGRIRKSR